MRTLEPARPLVDSFALLAYRQEVAPMSGLGWLLELALFLPQTSSAIQLRWSDGSSNLTFGTASRCTLLVQADPAEGTLPGQWRLLWLADSSGVNFVETDALTACSADTARVSAIEPPATTADSAAHQITTRFCSADETAATVAVFVLDQPGWSKGSLKVVAIDPANPDSNDVIESNEVTYNGGVEGTYAPTVLHASRSRSGESVNITAIGSGLQEVRTVSTLAADSSWVVPMQVAHRTSTVLTASAVVPAMLPTSIVAVSGAGATVASLELPADEIQYPENVLSTGYISYREDSTGFRPKDFSIFYDGLGRFHLFYMRQDSSNANAVYSGKKLVHVWTNDLLTWSSQDSSFNVGSGWDGTSLWAPHVFQVGNLYYMYYTGVDGSGNQRIGYATTTDLNLPGSSWSRNASHVFSANNADWAAKPGTNEQMRDPFIMRNPADTTRFLLFYSAVEDTNPDNGAIGVARSNGPTPTSWTDLGMIPYTQYNLSFTRRVESPMTFMHLNATHVPADTSWYLMFTNWWSPGSISFDVNAHTPADRSTTFGPNNWVRVNRRLAEWAGDDVVGNWANSEYVKWSSHEYLGGYIGQEIRFVQFKWRPGAAGVPDSLFLQNATGVADRATDRTGLGMRLNSRTAGREIEWQIELPWRMPVRLDVFDVAGRRVRTLADGPLPEGTTRVRWDGIGQTGEQMRSGVYFARLRCEAGVRTSRTVLLR